MNHRAPYVVLLTVLLILFPIKAYCDSDNDLSETQRIVDKIKVVGEAAAKVIIDGMSDDWSRIPLIDSPSDFSIDGSCDIIRVGLAPLEDRFLILIETRDDPNHSPWTFYINMTLTREPRNDFQIRFNGQGNAVRISSRFLRRFRDNLPGLKIAIGKVVEIELPLANLLDIMNPEEKKRFLAERRVTFARITAVAFDNSAKHVVDESDSVASYYLSQNNQPLDDELPRPPITPVYIDVPVEGKWYVTNGSWQGSHQWEYDIHIRDSQWRTTPVNDSKTNADYYAWNTKIYSPVDGFVSRVVMDTEDGIPGKIGSSKGTNNGVWIKSSDGVTIYLVHMKQGSVLVRKSQILKKGDIIGRTGSSGRSSKPHIHLGAGREHSLKFNNVRVGINGGENDPWERRLDSWDIRRGYYFRGKLLAEE